MAARDPRTTGGDRPDRPVERRTRRAPPAEPDRPVRRRSAEPAAVDRTADREPSPGRAPRRRATAEKLTARRAAPVAAADVRDLTGRTPEGITSIDRTEDGWRIGVEVLESRRVPDSNDILAVYLVALDDDGDLVSYRRERRYCRGRPEEDPP